MAEGCRSVPLLLLWVALTISASGGDTGKTTVKSLGDVVLPVYRGDQKEPFAIYRARSIRSDFQKRGFFKIGLLRTVIAVGLEVELAQPDSFSEAMDLLPAVLPELKKKSFSIQDFSVRMRGEERPLLKAREATPSKTRGNIFLSGVRIRGATNEITSAELRLNGPHTGEITSDSGTLFQPFKPTLSTAIP